MFHFLTCSPIFFTKPLATIKFLLSGRCCKTPALRHTYTYVCRVDGSITISIRFELICSAHPWTGEEGGMAAETQPHDQRRVLSEIFIKQRFYCILNVSGLVNIFTTTIIMNNIIIIVAVTIHHHQRASSSAADPPDRDTDNNRVPMSFQLLRQHCFYSRSPIGEWKRRKRRGHGGIPLNERCE